MSNDPRTEPIDTAKPRADPYRAAVREELRRAYIRQGTRPPAVVLLAVGAFGWFLHDKVPDPLLLAWAATVLATVAIRWALCVAFSRADVPGPQLVRRMRVIVALRILSGLVFSTAAVFWFPFLSVFEKMIFMIASLGWYATTVVVSLASPISAFMFGAALLGPAALAWSMQGDFNGFFVAIFSIAMVFLIRQATAAAHAVMQGAIASRLREEELARRLERHGVDLEVAMRAKLHFLAAASHDLRQPVTSMNLLLSALNASTDEASLRNVAAKLEAPVQALEEILSTLLEMSRLEAGIIEVTRRPCNTGEIVSPLIAEYRPRAAAKRVRLETSITELPLFVDPELVRRLLRNLIDNAIKFTDVGSVRLEAYQDDDAVVFVVADSGKGIPREQQQRIFEDYFQGENPQRDRRQGLGLGLAIVRRVASLLGGDVSVTSEPGRGARFEVRLPNALDSFHGEKENTAKRGKARTHLAAAKVLVVEDDRLVVDAMATLFKTLGVDARYALDGEDALVQTALGRFIPDLALVDYGLPGSLDGIALVRELRVRLPNCAFLLVTGDTRPEVMRRAAEAGIATLHKPVSVDRLNEKLKSMGIGA